jgi:hypothetical protein
MEKDSLVLIESDKITEKIQIVLRQTDYTEEVALEKLKEKNYDEIATIRAYFGITEKKAPPVKSVNQEIYKQLRTKLDSSMYDYRQKLDTDEAKK